MVGEGERKNLIDSFKAIRLYSSAVSFFEIWIEATTASFWDGNIFFTVAAAEIEGAPI